MRSRFVVNCTGEQSDEYKYLWGATGGFLADRSPEKKVFTTHYHVVVTYRSNQVT